MRIPRHFVLLGPGILFLVVFLVVPLQIVFAFGFFRSEQYQVYYDIGLSNYRLVLTRSSYLIPLLRSLIMALAVAIMSLIVSWPLAYWISRRKYRFPLILLTAAPFMIGAMLRVTSLQVLLAPAGLIEQVIEAIGIPLVPGLMYSQAGTFLALVYTWTPFAILVIYLALLKYEPRLEDAAAVLGARWPTRFLQIVLRENRTGSALAFTLVFIGTLGTSIEARFLGGPNGALYGTILHNQMNAGTWSRGSAMAFVLLSLSLLLLWLFLRFCARDLFAWTGFGERQGG